MRSASPCPGREKSREEHGINCPPVRDRVRAETPPVPDTGRGHIHQAQAQSTSTQTAPHESQLRSLCPQKARAGPSTRLCFRTGKDPAAAVRLLCCRLGCNKEMRRTPAVPFEVVAQVRDVETPGESIGVLIVTHCVSTVYSHCIPAQSSTLLLSDRRTWLQLWDWRGNIGGKLATAEVPLSRNFAIYLKHQCRFEMS